MLVDPGQMTVADQIRTFATAEVIVATHGAALANLVFASPRRHRDRAVPGGLPATGLLAAGLGIPGLRYRYLTAPGKAPRRGRAAAIVRDIQVDVPALRRMLDELD